MDGSLRLYKKFALQLNTVMVQQAGLQQECPVLQLNVHQEYVAINAVVFILIIQVMLFVTIINMKKAVLGELA